VKTLNLKKSLVVLIAATIFGLAPLSASALDIQGYSDDATDLACALNPACALPRGGVSEGILVLHNNSLAYATLAFGNEEAENIYYLPQIFGIDPSANTLTYLTEADGTFSDLFGVIDFGIGPVLGFISSPNSFFDGNIIPGGIQKTSGPSLGLVMTPGSVPTILYDATQYLDPTLRALGVTALFFSNNAVPEPGVPALLGLGFACMYWRSRKLG
jgi:hypothetical protein